MSTYILNIGKSEESALNEIRKILKKVEGEINPVSKSTIEDEYLFKQILKSKKTSTISFTDGISFMKNSIKKHGSKV